MSVEIATMGLYNGLGGVRGRGGSGPGKTEEGVVPLILVKSVEYEKDKKLLNDLITVKGVT